MLTPWTWRLLFISLCFCTLLNPEYAFANVSIKVQQVIRIESGVESELPIEIDRATKNSDEALLVIRGLPETVSLTNGRLFPSGTWVIKPSLMDDIRLITVSNAVESVTMTISLMTADGKLLSTASTRLLISPDALAEPTAAETVAALPTTVERQNAPETKRTITPADSERIIKMMERADSYLDKGMFEFARRFYKLVAEMGSPEGAEAIARTYDAEYLRRYPIIGGIEPDEAQAQAWYRKAKELRVQTTNVVADNPDTVK
jgi:hypothetical protein